MDEACTLAKAVLNANPNAILLTLMPMTHSSTETAAVTKNRRALEDRILGPLVMGN